MKIICPHCKTKNSIEFSEHIKCHHCDKSFKGYLYRVKAISKPAVVTTVIVGGIASQQIESIFENNRYSPEIEYSIISNCTNSSNEYLSRWNLEKNLKICVCALKKTMNQVEFEDSNMKYVFRESLRKCK